jgi:enediyne biosynthesis thioesterase
MSNRTQLKIRSYEYRHIVAFEETNLAGNVYYTNHLRWQGRCREMFLKQHAPDILKAFEEGFVLVTISVSCEYLAELSAFDEVIIRMQLGAIKQNRIQMLFEYWKQIPEGEQLVARGQQQVACMQRKGNQVLPTAIPPSLREGLRPYGEE